MDLVTLQKQQFEALVVAVDEIITHDTFTEDELFRIFSALREVDRTGYSEELAQKAENMARRRRRVGVTL